MRWLKHSRAMKRPASWTNPERHACCKRAAATARERQHLLSPRKLSPLS